MAEPRERFRSRALRSCPVGLRKGHDVAGRNRGRAPSRPSAEEERGEFGEARGLGRTSRWVPEPHAEEDSRGARVSIRAVRRSRSPSSSCGSVGFRRRAPAFDEAAAERFADLALACVAPGIPEQDRAHAGKRRGREAAAPPDAGLLRLLRLALLGARALASRAARAPFPAARFVSPARAALRASFTPEKVAGEVAYLDGNGPRDVRTALWPRVAAAARRRAPGWDDPEARAWSAALVPLERAAASRLADWLPEARLSDPRGRTRADRVRLRPRPRLGPRGGRRAMERLLSARIRELYSEDRSCPIALRAVRAGLPVALPRRGRPDAPAARAAGLRGLAARIPAGNPGDGTPWLTVAIVTDPSDGKLAHLDGLNLSRAWMLEGIAASLPPRDRRLPALRAAPRSTRASGLAAVTGAHYEGGHWLGTFAVYLVTGAGLPGSALGSGGGPIRLRRTIRPEGDITCRHATPAPSGKET